MLYIHIFFLGRAEPDPVLPHWEFDNQAGGDRLPLGTNRRADRQYEAPALLLRHLRQYQTYGRTFQDGMCVCVCVHTPRAFFILLYTGLVFFFSSLLSLGAHSFLFCWLLIFELAAVK